MNTTRAAVVKFSVEVVTLPVSDVDRALRFYVDQVGFTLDMRRTTHSASCNSPRQDCLARSE